MKGESYLLSLLATPLLMQQRIQLVFWAASALLAQETHTFKTNTFITISLEKNLVCLRQILRKKSKKSLSKKSSHCLSTHRQTCLTFLPASIYLFYTDSFLVLYVGYYFLFYYFSFFLSFHFIQYFPCDL